MATKKEWREFLDLSKSQLYISKGGGSLCLVRKRPDSWVVYKLELLGNAKDRATLMQHIQRHEEDAQFERDLAVRIEKFTENERAKHYNAKKNVHEGWKRG